MKSKPTESQIRARWNWEKPRRVKATRANIRLAVHRTRHPYGITIGGKPYVPPFCGMRVHTDFGDGVITHLGGGTIRNGDPEARIMLSGCRPVYLFQTALNGYSPL